MKFFAPGLLHEMNPIHVVRDPAAMNTAANPDLTLTASIQFIYIIKYMGLRAIKTQRSPFVSCSTAHHLKVYRVVDFYDG